MHIIYPERFLGGIVLIFLFALLSHSALACRLKIVTNDTVENSHDIAIMAAGTSSPVSKLIEPELLASNYATSHNVICLTREYYLAMTKGKIHLRLIIHQMPNVNFLPRPGQFKWNG
jgi:hypothetical protein